MTDDVIPVHDAIARALREVGVETMFGLMGDSNLFMVDAFVRTHQGRYVPATHEANAVLMAMGHAAMTGDVGVATVTQGPGLSNTITPLIDGAKGSLPVVLLCGDTPVNDPDHQQAIAQRALIDASGAGYARLRGPDSIAEDIAGAFRRARTERRPIVLNMPTEMMWENATYSGIAPAPRKAAYFPAEGDAIDDAIGIIAAARRPLVLAGRGAIGARATLIEFAERIGAPLATSLKAKGLFNGVDYNLGVIGTVASPAAAEVLATVDCVISFGAGLNRYTTAYGSNVSGRRLIQIDDTPTELGRRHRPDAAIVGDPGLVASILMKWLDEADIPSSRATDTIDATALSAPIPLPRETNRAGTIDLSRAMERINEALPADRVFVSDGGRFIGQAWTRIDVTGPENMLMTINTGAIGLGLGYAIGAAIARPDQRTLLVAGDGGFMMSGLSEFASAVREKLNLIIVICNDNAYGAEYIQFEDRQMDPTRSMFNWPPLADIARAMGGRGVAVTSEAELDQAVAEISSAEGPLLIELFLDPAAVPRLHH